MTTPDHKELRRIFTNTNLDDDLLIEYFVKKTAAHTANHTATTIQEIRGKLPKTIAIFDAKPELPSYVVGFNECLSEVRAILEEYAADPADEHKIAKPKASLTEEEQ